MTGCVISLTCTWGGLDAKHAVLPGMCASCSLSAISCMIVCFFVGCNWNKHDRGRFVCCILMVWLMVADGGWSSGRESQRRTTLSSKILLVTHGPGWKQNSKKPYKHSTSMHHLKAYLDMLLGIIDEIFANQYTYDRTTFLHPCDVDQYYSLRIQFFMYKFKHYNAFNIRQSHREFWPVRFIRGLMSLLCQTISTVGHTPWWTCRPWSWWLSMLTARTLVCEG